MGGKCEAHILTLLSMPSCSSKKKKEKEKREGSSEGELH